MPEVVMEGECEPVQLEPFVHQVGGHSSLLLFDEFTICKPLIKRERRFYETLPKVLRKVTPQYRGVVEVQFQEDSMGYLTLFAHRLDAEKSPTGSPQRSDMASNATDANEMSIDTTSTDSDSESTGAKGTLTAQQRFRMQRSGSIEIEGLSEKLQASLDKKQVISCDGHNPWSLRRHKEQLARMSKDGGDPHKFIMLENLAWQFELPCILDLKMGPRQHGDDVTEDKKRRHMKKCAESTSQKLGFRICGMQVYQVETSRFLCHNKYYGRKLDVEGVRGALCQFLYNGVTLRLDLVDEIVLKLQHLYETVKKQHTFRFYSSSLLVMYDGAVTADKASSLSSAACGAGTSQHDAGCLHGASTSHSCHHDAGRGGGGGVRDARARQDGHVNGGECSGGAGLSTGHVTCLVCRHNADHDQTFTHHHSPSTQHFDAGHTSTDSTAAGCHPQRVPPPHVEVRMIDFAHATHSGFRDDQTQHEGPDKGYLFGLENLLHMFRDIKDQHRPQTSPL